MHKKAIKYAALHNLSLAIAYGGPVFGKYALGPAVKEISSEQERGKVLEAAWSKFSPIDLAAHGIFAATWLMHRTALKARHIGGEKTKKLVAMKDVAIAGAVITGLANAIAGQAMKREFPEGVAVAAGGEPSPNTPVGAIKYQRFFQVVGALNKAFVGGAIVLGPAITITAIHESRRRGLFARKYR
jgi:hypothetical protein